MRITLALLIILLNACATLAPLSDSDKIKLTELALKRAIYESSRCFDCKIKNIFVGVNDVVLDPGFISRFSYDGVNVFPKSDAITSCDTGVVQKVTKVRGHAFSVFEINELSTNEAEVKWGYWYSCTKYSYQYTTFLKKDSVWQYASTRK